MASRLGRPFTDLDERIEAQAGESVGAIFATRGEAAFRTLEREALLTLNDVPPSIIACGGGAIVSDANRASLKEMGYIVYLEVSAAETLARIGDAQTRPLLAEGGLQAATTLLNARQRLYEAVADVTIDTTAGDRAFVVERVCEAIEQAGV